MSGLTETMFSLYPPGLFTYIIIVLPGKRNMILRFDEKLLQKYEIILQFRNNFCDKKEAEAMLRPLFVISRFGSQ